MTERIVWLLAVVLVGAAAFFGGQQSGAQSGAQRSSQNRQQFFADRGGPNAQGTPGAAAPGRGQGTMGTVDRVEGDQIFMKAADGTSVTVRLAQGGTVRKQVDGQISDVQPGERIVVVGTRNGDTIEATNVQVGGNFGGNSGGGNSGGGNGGGGRPTPVPTP